MTLLAIEKLTVLRGECPVVDHVDLSVGAGECVGLIGPNGAGKTTLMRAALGLERFKGTSSLARMSAPERARAAAFLPQSRQIAWPVDVETLVSLGRVPHLPRGGTISATDRDAIEQALHRLGLDGFRQRIATHLSGGEQGRVLIARALAQQTPLLLADEPIAGLDPAQQIATMQVFAELAREGRAVVVSLHDLGLAARHCTRLVLMHQGRVVADGQPDEVLTPELVAQVFGVSIWRQDSPMGPVFQPMDVL
ncbi:ABC transporter ATP-binding protein [Seohaeicola saemankumensis]|jgi:iron complex transport system ATP-binding protein|uniref:ABC transporter ATP-binding protein n=1 Tax=Seohaeicola TaxID=481178 RepID=UPI0035D094B3|nr:ABC transporter ATP-binding protein [Paracoccaceae bacterium]